MSLIDLKNSMKSSGQACATSCQWRFPHHTGFIISTILSVALLLSACAGMPPEVQSNLSTASAQQDPNLVQVANKPEGAQASTQDSLANSYKLGSGDKIRLNVFKETELSGEFEIDGTGSISMPLIGEISAKGLTVREFEQHITQKLKGGYLKDPKVNVEVVNYRPFFILGEVKKGGEYPYKAGLTVRDAVAMAGGYTYRANDKKVVIRRANSNQDLTFDLTSNVPVYPGDNVNIPERFF